MMCQIIIWAVKKYVLLFYSVFLQLWEPIKIVSIHY